jgi:hypothetical protein
MRSISRSKDDGDLSGKKETLVFLKRILGPTVPYITLGIGLLVLQNAWIAIFSYHLCMIIIIMLSHEHLPLRQLVRSTGYKIPLFTALIGACGGILLYLLWPLLDISPDIKMYFQNIGLTQAAWPYMIIYFILVNPWIEEYYWRGYLVSESKYIMPVDLFFAGYHVMLLAGKIDYIWLIVVLAALSFAAWLWRQANRISQGLLPSLASHMAADITIIFSIYWLSMR